MSEAEKPKSDDSFEALRGEPTDGWDQTYDIVIVGHGGAGAAAAIEATRAGASVAVLEVMSGGGGTTALSTGTCYFGAGTSIQKACGFDDDIPNMTAHVRLAAGRGVEEERVQLFCDNSVEHFNWFVSLGVEFKETFVEKKTTHPFTDDCLFYSGNELAYPFVEHARPAPRGHKPARPGEAGGYLMERMLAASETSGATCLYDCRVRRLVRDESGRVIGLITTIDGNKTVAIKARKAVILCAGGFIMNDDMLAKHAPDLLRCNYKTGAAGDDGSGILMGMGAGADVTNMSEGLVLNAYYPPSAHAKGIIVNEQGQRIVNEDAYIGRTSDAMLYKANGRAWLIVDNEIYGRTQAGHDLAAVEETPEALERSLGMPEGALVHTLEVYNRDAARGVDPYFHKAVKDLKPLTTAPLAALDCTTAGSIFGALTLGGLATQPTGEVLDPRNRVIGGLFAAGRCAAGLCREGRSYASGLSISDATYFGRVAARRAAALDAWDS
jgi:3-oxo-5alpha-steroid 4-dehydrogenase